MDNFFIQSGSLFNYNMDHFSLDKYKNSIIISKSVQPEIIPHTNINSMSDNLYVICD